MTSEFVIPVDHAAGLESGLAVFNPDSEQIVRLILRLMDASGQPFGEAVEMDLRPHQHLARFIFGPGQFFPAMLNFSGSMRVSAGQPIVPVDLSGDFDTGLAIMGPASGTAELQLRLSDERGLPAGEVFFNMAANRHLARFVSQWFPGNQGLRGSLHLISYSRWLPWFCDSTTCPTC